MITRRTFIGTAAALPALAQAPKKIAIIAPMFSDAQHIADRFIVGYPFDGEWHKPNTQVISTSPTIADVRGADAVLIFGGRDEYFNRVVKVFEADRRAVPVFVDGNLSFSFEKAKQMRDTSKRLKFSMLAGSALPVTWRLPDLELPLGCQIEDALMVGYGDSAFDALEAMQCMLERRNGGELGVKNVQLIEGDAVWYEGNVPRWSKEMLTAALSRSDNLKGATVTDGRTQDMVGTGVLPQLVKNPSAYFVEYRDGTKATLLMLTEAVGDFTFAVKVKGKIQSTQFLLTPEPNVTYSALLAHKIEEMIMTGVAPYPVERTLLVSGILESCLESRLKKRAIETPHLSVSYMAPRNS